MNSCIPHIDKALLLYATPADKEFASKLSGRFQPKEGLTLTDIYDGSTYSQHMSEGGFLRDPMNISLVMNTDGVQVFKSSGISLWPVYFVINELPPLLRCTLPCSVRVCTPINENLLQCRFCKRNTILAGLWCSQNAPPMFQFLQPILERCKLLQVEGVWMRFHVNY